MRKELLTKFGLLAALLMPAGTIMAQTTTETVYEGHEVTAEGAWCWFADPRALHYENEDGTINATYLGYIDIHGNIKAMQYDFVSKKRSEVLVRSYFQPDDHDNPTFLVLPDERIMMFYSRHTDEACFYYRISQKKGDITTLGEEKKIITKNNTTYPSPFILSDDPTHIYLCWRGINWHPTIAKLSLPDEDDNVDVEWGPYQIVQSTGARPYAKYFSNGKDKLMLAYTTGHPDNEYPNYLYFNRIDINKLQLEDINGNKLSTIANGAFNVSKTSSYVSSYPATVVDNTSDKRDWLWQVAQDSDGHPCIAMVKIDNSKDSHDYYFAQWTGKAWQKTFLANAGGQFHQTTGLEKCYSSGMSLNPANPHEIYVSLPTTGTNGKKYEIYKMTVDESGSNVTKEQLTQNSSYNNVRPYVIPGSENSPLKLGWMYGNYYDWIVSKDRPNGYCTAIHADYEWPYSPEDLTSGLVLHETFDSTADGSAYNDQSTAEVKSGLLLTDAGKYAQTSLAEGDFTVSLSLQLSQQKYYGEIFTAGNIKYGLDSLTMKPYLTIGGKTYSSTNLLGTSDVWKTQSRGTNGVWYTPEKLNFFNLTITYADNTVTTYINGLLDQRIETADAQPSTSLSIGGFKGWVEDFDIYSRAFNDAEIKTLAAKSVAYTLSDEMKNDEILESLNVPSMVYTDLPLATTSSGKKITWTSSDESVLKSTGIVTLPQSPVAVTLTAAIGTQKRDFNVTVCPRDLQHNVILRYTFESQDVYESNGAKYIADMSGNGRDAEIKGSADINGELDLTANTASAFSTNGYLLAPSGILENLRSYTFYMSVTPKSLNNAPRIYDFGSASSNSVFGRANKLTGGVKYNGATTTMVNANTQLQTGKTSYVAFTYDAATKKTSIYLNGNLVGSGTNVTHEAYEVAAIGTDKRNYIGRTQWWDSSVAADNIDYCGTMDNFYVFDIALTQDEIKQLNDETTGIGSMLTAKGQTWLPAQSVCRTGETVSISGGKTDGRIDVSVYSSNGSLVNRVSSLSAPVTLKAPKAAGVYVIKVSSASKTLGTSKLIVR